MKFGLYVRTKHQYDEIKSLAKRADELGFDSIHVNDHLIGFDPERKEPYLEAMILMTALAVETKHVKVGHVVLANSFRNPALLAKMISTLDHVSNGRALLWIGTGWYEEEYKAYGYPFPSAGERVAMLEEALKIFKKLFTEEVTDFEGKYWTLINNKNFPKPIQKPWPQIVVGASKPRMLTIACREADGVNLPHVGEEAAREKIEFIKKQLKIFNKNPDEFEISTFNGISIVAKEDEKEKIVDGIRKRLGKPELKDEEILANRFIGTIDEIKERIKAMEKLGVKKMVVAVSGSEQIKNPLQLFKEEIMK